MALIVKTNTKLDHPTEPDAWVTVRLPLSGGNVEGGATPSDIVASAIVEWSYEIPPTGDAVRDLDVPTYQWLVTEVGKRAGIRSDEEKKDSSGDSSPTSVPAKEASRKSSGT